MSDTFAGLLERHPAPWTCKSITYATAEDLWWEVTNANGKQVAVCIGPEAARAIAALPALVGAMSQTADAMGRLFDASDINPEDFNALFAIERKLTAALTALTAATGTPGAEVGHG
jgi:hypothetical protein